MEVGACTLFLVNMILAGTLLFNNPADVEYPGVSAEIAALTTSDENRAQMQVLYEQSQLDVAEHEAAMWGSPEQLADLAAQEEAFFADFPFPVPVELACGDELGPGKFFLIDDVECSDLDAMDVALTLKENTTLFMGRHDVINTDNNQMGTGILAEERVKILGGFRATLKGFNTGIEAAGHRNLIKHVIVRDNNTGILLTPSAGVESASNNLSHNLIAYVWAKKNAQNGIHVEAPAMANVMDIKRNRIAHVIANDNGSVGILVSPLEFDGELKKLSVTHALAYENGTPEGVEQTAGSNQGAQQGGIVISNLVAGDVEKSYDQFDIQDIEISHSIAVNNQDNGIELTNLSGEGIRDIHVFKNISIENDVEGFDIGDFTAEKIKDIDVTYNFVADNGMNGIVIHDIGMDAFGKGYHYLSRVNDINVTHNIASSNRNIGIMLMGINGVDLISNIVLSHNLVVKNGEVGLFAGDLLANDHILNVKVDENKANFNGCGITLRNFAVSSMEDTLSSGIRHVRVRNNQANHNFLADPSLNQVSSGILLQRVGEGNTLSKLDVSDNDTHFNDGVGLALDWTLAVSVTDDVETQSLLSGNRVKENNAWFNSIYGIFAKESDISIERPSILIGKNTARRNGVQDLLDEKEGCAPFIWTVNLITSGFFPGCPNQI